MPGRSGAPQGFVPARACGGIVGYADGGATEERSIWDKIGSALNPFGPEEAYRAWPADLVRTLAGAVALPGDVYAGRADPMSEEGIERAADLAGAVTLGGLTRGISTIPRASKAVPGYNPPIKTPRAFEADYPNGAPADASGRLTHDIEGRPLGARHVAGRTHAGGGDAGIPEGAYVSLAEGATGGSPQAVAGRALGGDAGQYVVTRDRRSGKIVGRDIFVDQGLSPDAATRVLAHEVAHAINEIAGQIPTAGLNDELRGVYNTLFTGRERTTGRTGPQHLGYKGDDIPRELMAEAVRGYMADPNYLKTVAPKTAKVIRRMVNEHPTLSRIIQFNSIALPALAGGVGIPQMADDSPSMKSGGIVPDDAAGIIAPAAPVGLIDDPTPGRTDRLPMVVTDGTFIIPADVVSGLGQGNTMAGAGLLDEMLENAPEAMASGGKRDGVEIIAAGGEYVVPPYVVERLGGGDRKKGHSILDAMVRKVRKQAISHMKSLPGPVK